MLRAFAHHALRRWIGFSRALRTLCVYRRTCSPARRFLDSWFRRGWVSGFLFAYFALVAARFLDLKDGWIKRTAWISALTSWT